MDGMLWEVEFTDEFEEWWETLAASEQEDVRVAVDALQERGAQLGRPFVDTLEGSRHANMKEVRLPEGNLRVLFAFDPRRMAILLIGGDKTGRWNEFYQRMIPMADDLYDSHLDELRKEGEIP